MKNLQLVAYALSFVCLLAAAVISRNDVDKLLVRMGLALLVATYFLV